MATLELQSLLRLSLPPLPTTLDLPPLPEIRDAEVQKQVFTHTSYHAKPRRSDDGMFDEQFQSLDNEKLEHIGDSSLGFAVTGLLQDLYPSLTPGNATLMKGHLVSNATLAQLSKRYGLPDRLLADPSALYNLRNGEKTCANLFEAYVAGVFYSFIKLGPAIAIPTPPRSPSDQLGEDQVDVDVDTEMQTSLPKPTRGQAQDLVELWLRPLFTPMAAWLLEHLKQERLKVCSPDGEDHDVDQRAKGATSRLNEWFATNGAGVPDYRAVPSSTGQMWTVTCCAVDKENKSWCGEATRLSKRSASTVAAYKVCQDLGI